MDSSKLIEDEQQRENLLTPDSTLQTSLVSSQNMNAIN